MSLPSFESIASNGTTLAATNVLLLVGLPWLWRRSAGTERASLFLSLLFLGTFSLFLASTVLATLGLPASRGLFCVGCALDPPLLFLAWLFARKYAALHERLETKASEA